ncbi:MAG: IS3 family transposase [Spirochaetia bacterium]|nr:IS3 family transposase [Spirochaetia bacterium]
MLKSEGLYTHFSKKDINNHQISGRRISGIVEDYIIYYNQVRRKQELGNLSPTAFRMVNPLGTLPVMYTVR